MRRALAAGRAERAVLVDCLTLWLTNLMLAQRDAAAAADALLTRAGRPAGAGGAGLQRGRAGRRAAGRAEPRLRRPCRPAAPAARRHGRLGPAHGGRPAARPEARRHRTRPHAPPEHAAGRHGSDVEAAVDLGPDAGRDRPALGGRQRPRLPRRGAGAAAGRTRPACGWPTCCGSATRSRSTSTSSGSSRMPGWSCVRLLGGRGYWPYGLEQVAAACRAHGIPLACLPGDDRADPELAELSTVPPEPTTGSGATSVTAASTTPSRRCATPPRLIGREAACAEPRAAAARRALPPGPARRRAEATTGHAALRRVLPGPGPERRPGADRRAARARSRPGLAPPASTSRA